MGGYGKMPTRDWRVEIAAVCLGLLVAVPMVFVAMLVVEAMIEGVSTYSERVDQ